MSHTPILEVVCHKIFDILLEAGAMENCREDFLRRMSETCEYRFGGSLGFGGKFYNLAGSWYVSCYPEDRGDERAKLIENINAKLKALQES